MRFRAAQRWAVATDSQLKISYHGGPLAKATLSSGLSHLIRRAPMQGDRGPDADCQMKTTQRATMLGEQIQANWALLLYGSAQEQGHEIAELARSRIGESLRVVWIQKVQRNAQNRSDTRWSDAILVDHRGEFARAWQVGRQAYILLRPDGHVAWRSFLPDKDALLAWLDCVFDLGHVAKTPTA